jgi:CheY-like chemotaxis protein
MAKKVLIVDDDKDLVEAISVLLQAKGYLVICALSGQEGYAKAKTDAPQLIILDVMMAHQSEGFDIARTLKNDDATKNIPIVLLTGIRREMKLPFGFAPDEEWLPVKAVLEKPVKPETLLKTVSENIL